MAFSDYFIKTSMKDHIEGYPIPPKYMMTDRMYNICIGFAITALIASAFLASVALYRVNSRSEQSPAANTATTSPAAKK